MSIRPTWSGWSTSTRSRIVATLLPLGALGEIVGHQRIYLGGCCCSRWPRSAARWPGRCRACWSRGRCRVSAQRHDGVNTALVRFVFPSRCWAAASVTTPWWSRPPSPSGRPSRRHPCVRFLAVAVRDQSSLRPDLVPIGIKTLPPLPRATHPSISSARRWQRLSRPLHCRDRRRRASGRAGLGARELVAALFGLLLMRRHADHPAPMLPIDLFRRPLFALSAATAICSFAVQGFSFVALPFYFEDRGPLSSRDWLLHDAMAAGGCDHGAARRPAVRSLSAGSSVAFGLVVLAPGMALLALLPANPSAPISSGA